jgi:putative membrane-bound dehydrogenase-like protein
MKHALSLLAALLIITPARSQQPLPKVPDGFKVELVLQAPDIEAPTALCVAPNGDVYFAEDPMDMRGPSNQNLDRIWLLKGGDPKRKILFADKLWAVMGLEVVRDKLYVVHYPYVSVFTLDAQGKAKSRTDLFTDLGPKSAPPGGFNDHVPSGIRMGMDGWLYVSVGDKGIPKMTRKEKDKGSVHVAEGRWRHSKEGHHISLEGGGVIRFRPDGSGLEVFASGTRNHLDVPMDEHDRIFVRDNTDDGDGWNTRFMYLPHGAFMGYPWAFTRHPKEVLPMIRDFGGGSPCGGWVYCDDGLPEKYRGRVFHCEWGKGKVLAVKVRPKGAGFEYVDEIAFMDPNGTGVKDFRPFTLRPTADGRGFYVTDWGFSGWMQPVKTGRIWKVTYTKGDVKPAPRGTAKMGTSVADLVKALDHPAHTERLRVQRILEATCRGKGGAIALRDAERYLRDEQAPAALRRHLLWAFANLGDFRTIAHTGRQAKEPGVLAEAVRALADFPPGSALLSREVFAKESQVRLQVALALRTHWHGFTSDEESICDQLLDTEDAYLRFAAVKALQAQRKWKLLGGRVSNSSLKRVVRENALLAFADAYDRDAVMELKRLATDRGDNALRAQAVELLARVHHDRKPYAGGWWGTRPEQQKPPARVVEWEGTPLVRDALLKALGDKAAEVRKAAAVGLLAMNDPSTLAALTRQFTKESDPTTRADIVRAVGGLKGAPSVQFLDAVLRDAKNPDSVRVEAVAALAKISLPAAGESLARTASDAAAPALQAAALDALGASKSKPTKAAAEAALKSTHVAVRKAAAGALARLGDVAAAPRLVPLLADKDAAVRTAAIRALGDLKASAAVPALVKAASEQATQFDAITALAKIPDVRALNAYLTGLQSKNVELRQACRQAIAAVRDQAAPVLEELAKRNEVPAAVASELRTVYASYSPILSWKLIGPFPNDGKAYPPEKELHFNAVYKGAGANVRWSDRRADARAHGKIDLLALYNPNQNVVAYGYAEIPSGSDREANLLVGSDDSIVIWLNGKKVHDFPNTRAWQHDADTVKVHMKKGKNALLIKCGQQGGDWAFSVAVSGEAGQYTFLKGGAQKFDLDAFRTYAQTHRGDAERGRKLFFDLKGVACAKCHAVAGQGGKVGPDMAGIALRYKREDLITSVLEPSKQIANGYETLMVTTADGKQYLGVFKGETGEAVRLMDAEGKLHTIPKADIDSRRLSPISTMPNGLAEGMTLQDFADLIAYLEARREEAIPPRKDKGPAR